MKFHVQEFRHDPKSGVYGDCQRAVIACLLGLELCEVPNFNDGEPDAAEFFDRINDFLAKRGLCLFSVAFNSKEDATRHMCLCFEDQIYCLSGTSPRGVDHVTIWRNAEMMWDTHPDAEGLVGPCGDGLYWVDVLTIKINPDKE